MSRRGYTLVELMVVVFLVGAMLFLAVPSMRSVLMGDQLQAASRQIVGAARELRINAVREQLDYVLHFDMSRNRYWTYTADMTLEKRDERQKLALSLPEGIRITDIYHVGDAKKNEGDLETIFYRNGVVQPTVIHLSKDDQSMTIILEPFLSQVRIFDRYVEFPVDEVAD